MNVQYRDWSSIALGEPHGTAQIQRLTPLPEPSPPQPDVLLQESGDAPEGESGERRRARGPYRRRVEREIRHRARTACQAARAVNRLRSADVRRCVSGIRREILPG